MAAMVCSVDQGTAKEVIESRLNERRELLESGTDEAKKLKLRVQVQLLGRILAILSAERGSAFTASAVEVSGSDWTEYYTIVWLLEKIKDGRVVVKIDVKNLTARISIYHGDINSANCRGVFYFSKVSDFIWGVATNVSFGEKLLNDLIFTTEYGAFSIDLGMGRPFVNFETYQ